MPDHKQERAQMKRTRAKEPPVDRRVTAANEEFNGVVSAVRETARPQQGWDPYEVWLTRVKAPAQAKRERGRIS
jgi:hypothetical protein